MERMFMPDDYPGPDRDARGAVLPGDTRYNPANPRMEAVMRHGVRMALCAAMAAMALPGQAQTLRVAVSSPVTSIDPHYHNLAPNLSLAAQIYGRLVEMDANQRPIPGLALSWKLVAPDTWEFKLRDAKFQNGNDFTADDVVFTLDRVPKVPNSPSSFAVFTKPVVATE